MCGGSRISTSFLFRRRGSGLVIGAKQVEAQFSADVVMRMLEFLDSEQGWLGQTAASDGSYSGQPAVRMA